MDAVLDFQSLNTALTNCMAAHPPVAPEFRMHPDAHAMSGPWATMVIQRHESLPLHEIKQPVLEAIERWK